MARKRRAPGTGQLDLFPLPDEPAPPAPAPPPPTPIPEPAMSTDQPTDPTLPPPPPPEVPETPAPPAAQDSPPPAPLSFDDCPPPPDTPPEVAADIRAMFLEEEERQRNEETITIREGKPPLVTGIYRKPRPTNQKPLVMPLTPPSKPSPAPAPSPSSRPARPPVRPAPTPRPATPSTTWSPGRPASPSPSPSAAPSSPSKPPKSSSSLLSRLRNFFSDAPLGRKGLIALLASILLVAILAWWLGRPKPPTTTSEPPTLVTPEPPPTPTLDVPRLAENSNAPAPLPEGGGVSAPGGAPVQPPASAPATPSPAASAIPLPRIPGATVIASADGSWLVRYDDPVFVSTDRISVEGMKALKATAAALLKLPNGATVTIHGHTDDIPPPPDTTGPFRTNADLATARAEVAKEHLHVFCKRLPRYTFTSAAPGSAPAPYPNDTDAHRRLNRTITLQVTPTP